MAMVKCANCENPASYTQADPGVNSVNYCQKCLPGWLHQRALAGHFPLVEPVVGEESPKPAKKKAAKSENN